jgi:hypothetical protein
MPEPERSPVNEFCCPEHGIHLWIMSAARRLSFRDLTDQEIFDRIHILTRGARRHVPDSEIIKSIAKVRSTDVSVLIASCPPAVDKPTYRPETLERLAGQHQETVDSDYLALRSKFTCWNRSPAGFLHKLFRVGERVIVFSDFYSQGQALWLHPGPVGNLSTLDRFRTGELNVWFLSNPVDGRYYSNPREGGKESRRSEEAITWWRYAVIESDQADPKTWLRALVQLPLPISAIYSSGGKSIHALVRIDACSKLEWDRLVATLKPALVKLGADPAALSAVRLTRLPNCVRGETGALQELLYFDDDPDDVTICRKPRRDPDSLRLAL